MKKKSLYLLVIIVAAILLLMLGTTKVNAVASYKEGTIYENFKYQFVSDIETNEGNIFETIEEIENHGAKPKYAIVVEYLGNNSNITIPSYVFGVPVEGVGFEAFQNNVTLKTVILSNNMRYIDDLAFNKCTALTNIEIPNTLTDICEDAFIDCINLKEITLSKNIKKIEEGAFLGCNNLTVNCYIDSYVHEYAVNNKINFKLLDTKNIADVCNCEIEGMYSENYTYTGKAIKPYVYITTKNKVVELRENTDYTLSYKNNVNIGMGTVTVEGKGNFTGTITKNFKIVPPMVKITSTKNVKTKSVQIKWKRNSYVDGYEIYMAEAKKEKHMKTTSKLTLRKSTSVKSKALKNIPKNSYVYVIKKNVKKSGGYTWYKVRYFDYKNGSEKTGYVASKYLKDVYYEGKYKKIKTIKGNKTTSYKKTKLTKNKKYVFKVKAYKNVNGKKYYSDDEFYEYGDVEGYWYYIESIKWVTIKK